MLNRSLDMRRIVLPNSVFTLVNAYELWVCGCDRYHSRSHSALSRVAVSTNNAFNQTFAAGDANIYSSLHDEQDGQ